MGEEVFYLDNEGKSGSRGLDNLGTIRHNRLNRTNKSAQNQWEQLTRGLWFGGGIDETNKDHNSIEGQFQHDRGFGGLFSFYLRRKKEKKKAMKTASKAEQSIEVTSQISS